MRNLGKTVLGWFVVQEDVPPSEEGGPIQKEEDPPEPPIVLPPVPGEVVPAQMDFSEIFLAGGVEGKEQECIQKALELLQALPSETPTMVKKQIVEASLRTFGFPIESILEAGRAELETLEEFLRVGKERTHQLIEAASARIKRLQAEIEELGGQVASSLREQEAQKLACASKQQEIQSVLEFFGQEVPSPEGTPVS